MGTILQRGEDKTRWDHGIATTASKGAVRMNPDNICAEFSGGLAALFQCTAHGEYHRIRTPYLYPDGDNIDVFCKAQGEVTLVSDLGETTRWLRMQTVSPRRSPKQKALLEDVCVTHGVEFYKGMLQARHRQGDGLSAVVFRVAQAALRAADLCRVDGFADRWISEPCLTTEEPEYDTTRDRRIWGSIEGKHKSESA